MQYIHAASYSLIDF